MATRIGSLVSTVWLKSQLSATAKSKNIRVLDTSWTALKSGYETYLSKHIPTAQFFDLNECVTPTPTLPRNLPHPECFQEYVASLGVSTDSHVVVYDRGGMLAAARTWWMFRAYGLPEVSVLNGGFKHWEFDGNDNVSGKEDKVEKGHVQVKINKALITNFDEMISNIKCGSTQVLDARKPEHFNAQETEPTGFTVNALVGMNQPLPTHICRGHVPGAHNLLEDFVLDDHKQLLPADELAKLFTSAGVDLKLPLTTMCYNGHAACLLALAAHQCGKEDTSVYYGSWTEYGQRADMTMITKPHKPRSVGA